MNLTFHDQPFEIPDEWKITLWRFNSDGASPFSARYGADRWDENAKAVSADAPGFFCVQEEQLSLYGNTYITFGLFTPNPDFLMIEADRRDILFVDDGEISVSRGNIIGVFGKAQFQSMFQPYSYMYTDDTFSGYIKASSELLNIEWVVSPSAPDGFSHSLRVEKNIHLLGMRAGIKKRERDRMRAFAYWHDVMRSTDHDPEHGKRASEVIEQGRGRNKFQTGDVDRLSFACKHHSTMLRSGDPLIDICFDADRLDLFYRGFTPDPDLMATEVGSYYAEHYDEYLTDIKQIRI